MMTKKKKLAKTLAAQHSVPQSRDAVIAAISEIGAAMRERTRIETEMNDEISAIKARYELLAEPHSQAITALQAGVQTWCEANRNVLTSGGKVKTHAFASGEVRWRTTPPSVSIRAVDAVLKTLEESGLERFIRTKREVNKDAILLEPEAVRRIAGITINQNEEFVVVPFEAKLDEVA
jgi:phage host-nuclease inhibitor protein Gam